MTAQPDSGGRANDAARPQRILHLEDSGADAQLIVMELRRTGARYEFRRVESEAEFHQALVDFAPDLVLSDLSLPGFDGTTALAIAHETAPDVPFIFVCGTAGAKAEIAAMKAGAASWVSKDALTLLGPAVEQALARSRRNRDPTTARKPAT